MSVCVYCVHIPNFRHILNFELKSYVHTHVEKKNIYITEQGFSFLSQEQKVSGNILIQAENGVTLGLAIAFCKTMLL